MEKLTSEQILKLSKEDFIRYINEVKKEYYENLEDVGDSNYEKYSTEEKIDFWTETMNRQMRLQA